MGLYFFAEGKLLSVEGKNCTEVFQFVDPHFLLLQELQFFPQGGFALGTEELQTILQVVEFDSQLFVLVCHACDLRRDHLVFLLQLIILLGEAFVVLTHSRDLGVEGSTLSTKCPIYFSC